ncbi:MAG: ribosomal L7Ae/L30e/S12e/Gadd45 family protein [Clostridia bacterium]|nr:ribosomal L7Ae/L30e/S12e/Gadd45 family protein [Clostridia bacterium]
MNRALGTLGMAQRCGRVICGEEPCRTAVRSGKAHLVLVDEGASAGSRKALADTCAYYGVTLRLLPPQALGKALGRPGRMAAAVTDPSFADRLSRMLEQQSKPDTVETDEKQDAEPSIE